MINILYLDSTNNNLVILILFKDKKIFKIVKRFKKTLGIIFLKEIENLLHQTKTKPQTLTAITVVTGPGSFSSLRVGVVVANTLAWLLKIPIISLRVGETDNDQQLYNLVTNKLKKAGKRFKQIRPFYNKEPNITWPKK